MTLEFEVWLHRKHIDTVYWHIEVTEEEVRQSLINHDGYSPLITVRRVS